MDDTITEPGTAISPDTAQQDPAPDAGQEVTAIPGQDGRRLIAVSDLAGHPGNVRADLSRTPEFTASIASEGVRIPLLVTPAAGGGWRVIEGHRRLAAAIDAGLAEVPCDVDAGREGDEAGQFLDMLLANGDGYRVNYTAAEEAAALFAAHEAGASRTRLRKATGRTAVQVKTALTAGQLPAETVAAAVRACSEATLDDLALLAEFDGDQAATERLLACLERGYPLEHVAERIRLDRAESAAQARLRADLAAAGVTVTDGLPPGACWLNGLRHEGQDLTAEAHAACPGHGAALGALNPLHPRFYCTSPASHGHADRHPLHMLNGTGSSDQPPGTGATPEPVAGADRRLVITGNKAWQAAAEVRRRWIASSLLARRALPREAGVFLARQILTMPDPLRSGLPGIAGSHLFTAITGCDPVRLAEEAATATAGRLTVIALVPVIACYEQALTEGEGRNTWRTDRYSPCPRAAAGHYLAFLAGLGYQLSAIEQAVADSIAWTGQELPGLDDDSDREPGEVNAA
jgi:ParB family chromosome partitioning protein